MQNNSESKQQSNSVRELTVNGLLIAMVFVATMFINIRLPISVNGGLIHLGNVVLFTIAILYGKKKGAIAGAFGMGLFDILSGWTAWAPFTFVIRGVMGYLIGSISHANGKRGKNPAMNFIAIFVASIWMIAGYYIAEGLLYGNWVAPATSIPGNITQLAFGLVSLVIAPVLQRIKPLQTA